MIKLNSVKANLKIEEEGEWIAIPDPGWEGVELLVRSTETPSYRIKIGQLGRRLARQYQGKEIPPLVLDAEQGKLYADELLRGWKGFDQDYTSELAADMLPTPEWRELRTRTLWAAGRVGVSRGDFVEQAAKNSETPSAGI